MTNQKPRNDILYLNNIKRQLLLKDVLILFSNILRNFVIPKFVFTPALNKLLSIDFLLETMRTISMDVSNIDHLVIVNNDLVIKIKNDIQLPKADTLVNMNQAICI